jgi:hypothetical protein
MHPGKSCKPKLSSYIFLVRLVQIVELEAPGSFNILFLHSHIAYAHNVYPGTVGILEYN